MTTPHDATACERLAALADDIASGRPSPRSFLVELGGRAAGIRHGARGVVDLAVGGANPIVGGGFRPHFDDGTPGQVRHFVGVARSVTLLGGWVTRWLSEVVRRDPRGSGDGELTEMAQVFARDLLDGRLAVADAGDWIRDRICT